MLLVLDLKVASMFTIARTLLLAVAIVFEVAVATVVVVAAN